MLARYLSLTFALLALAGAVLFAQKKAKDKPQPVPVFDTSKSGVPTPVDATDEEKERIRRENEEFAKRKKLPENVVTPAQNAPSQPPEEKWPEPKEYPRKKKKEVHTPPRNKSYAPE